MKSRQSPSQTSQPGPADNVQLRQDSSAPAASPGWAVQAQATRGNAFVQAFMGGEGVQAKGELAGDAVSTAKEGVRGGGGPLPHADRIQGSFGRHDVSGVEAHVGGDAAGASEAIGAEAYATGNDVAFKGHPDLHTAAHEAAHVVQQRQGVSLLGGVGQAGDRYEQHADSVADAVVQGRPAEGLLDQMSGSSGGASAVQKEGEEGAEQVSAKTPEHDASGLAVDKDKLEQLGEAMDAALAMVTKAVNAAKLGDASYMLWMDNGATADTKDQATKDRVAHVLAGYESIKKCLETDKVIFKKWDLPADHKFKYDNTYAYVRGGEEENNMYLGGVFWVAKTTGLDSKAGTIIHELSHRLHATKDHHYGAGNSKDSAKNTPEKATTNADNYEHLSESI